MALTQSHVIPDPDILDCWVTQVLSECSTLLVWKVGDVFKYLLSSLSVSVIANFLAVTPGFSLGLTVLI
ncbi:hypothetical protein EYB25_009165 [Talaromyces marneffei]|nr:hypothetical protein EYB25_009165 [Talaromyces marneffei]